MLHAKQGQTFSFNCQARHPDKSPYDLSDYVISARINKKDSTSPIIDYAIGTGIEILNASAGTFRIDINTATLTPAFYLFDIKYSNGAVIDYADFSRQCDTLNFEGQWVTLTVD
jgi:hypothetical protein